MKNKHNIEIQMEEFFYDETKNIKRQDLKEYVELMLLYDFMPEYIEDGN